MPESTGDDWPFKDPLDEWLDAFMDWLPKQAGRNDSVGQLARSFEERTTFLRDLMIEMVRAGRDVRGDAADAFRMAVREWRALQEIERRSQAALFLEARCFELLSMVHAQPDGPCRPDKHCTECHVIGLVFGHPSWDHWATLAAGTEPD